MKAIPDYQFNKRSVVMFPKIGDAEKEQLNLIECKVVEHEAYV